MAAIWSALKGAADHQQRAPDGFLQHASGAVSSNGHRSASASPKLAPSSRGPAGSSSPPRSSPRSPTAVDPRGESTPDCRGCPGPPPVRCCAVLCGAGCTCGALPKLQNCTTATTAEQSRRFTARSPSLALRGALTSPPSCLPSSFRVYADSAQRLLKHARSHSCHGYWSPRGD